MNYASTDPINWLSWSLKYDKYIEKCKGCGQEIYTVPEIKPICDQCTSEGKTCGCADKR